MIRQAGPEALPTVAALARQLWPEHTLSELEGEFALLLSRADAAVFLAWEQGRAVGFAQCQLRHDYVEGTSGCPVGYLEGIFVVREHRRRGHGRALLAACERWARAMGCEEFASDCALGNEESFSFHLGAGFAEVGRIICFVKPLVGGSL